MNPSGKTNAASEADSSDWSLAWNIRAAKEGEPLPSREEVLDSDLRTLGLCLRETGFDLGSCLAKAKNFNSQTTALSAALLRDGLEASEALVSLAEEQGACLRCPVLCMVLSIRNLKRPSQECAELGGSKEDCVAVASRGSDKTRTLLLKLSDARGFVFNALDLGICGRGLFEASPSSREKKRASKNEAAFLLPGTKLLLERGSAILGGYVLLSEGRVKNLGGDCAALREAFDLKEEITARRKGLQSDAPPASGDSAHEQPPPFVPFSNSRVRDSLAEAEVLRQVEAARKKREALEGQTLEAGFTRRVDLPLSNPSPSTASPSKAGEAPKHQRLLCQQKESLASLSASPAALAEAFSRRGRGARGRRGETRSGEQDEARPSGRRERFDERVYMKSSRGGVTLSLLDLIASDASKTNSTAATRLLVESEETSSLRDLLSPRSARLQSSQDAGGLRASSAVPQNEAQEAFLKGKPIKPSRGRGRGARGRGRGAGGPFRQPAGHRGARRGG